MRAESGALALATSIAAMDRDELSALARRRRVASAESVREPLGLALELLRPDSLSRALSTAHRDDLLALLALRDGTPADAQATAQLMAAGLVGRDAQSHAAVSLPEVASALGKISLADAPHETPTPAAAGAPDTSIWFGQAITSVRRAASMLRALTARPMKLGRKGAPAVASLRELAETVHTEQHPVEHLVTVLRSGNLLTSVTAHGGKQLLVPSFAADDWLNLDYADRWLTLAKAALAAFDARARGQITESGNDLRRAELLLPFNFPLLPPSDTLEFARATGTAEELGLSVNGHLTPVGIALLQGDLPRAELLAREHIPPPVDGVYLQPDLSLIAPGPLHPDDEQVLSKIAVTEQLGSAASLRLSSASLTRAVQRGFAPQEIRAHLQRLSLTGIPQPLDYLLTELERSANQMHQLEEDLALQPTHTDVSRQTKSASWRSFEDVDAADRELANSDSFSNILDDDATAESDPIEAMIDRVFATAQAGDHGDLERRLELAIRERRTLKVTAVSGNTEHVFTLMPVSLQGGRLRASDEKAGVVRTLPLTAITAIEP